VSELLFSRAALVCRGNRKNECECGNSEPILASPPACVSYESSSG
jgi:hypothetical protein